MAAIVHEELLTASACARILERSESTIRYWTRKNILRPLGRTSSGISLYSGDEVRRLKAALVQRVASSGDEAA